MAVTTRFTLGAEHLLRRPGEFDWATITLLALVVYADLVLGPVLGWI